MPCKNIIVFTDEKHYDFQLFIVSYRLQIDRILELYKHMSQNPSLASAKIISIARKGISIQSVWFQRNLERNIKQKFTQDFSLDADLQLLVESFPVDVTTE